ncbi:MbeB family mobilization protein [Pseudoalteromonas sp. 120-MNA-CIBAN-0494]|uniref:MbeB family mobilization protein n=2 Tax=Pseudoalteromonas TaxID=53246 RepID=UPI00331E16BC
MNHLSELAQTLESNSKQQTELTKQAVSKEFKTLNKFIKMEVKKSESETKNAIQELNQYHLSQYKRIKIALLIVSLLLVFLAGMLFQAHLDTPIQDVIDLDKIWNRS